MYDPPRGRECQNRPVGRKWNLELYEIRQGRRTWLINADFLVALKISSSVEMSVASFASILLRVHGEFLDKGQMIFVHVNIHGGFL